MNTGFLRLATLPDELSQGYAGRLARVNGFGSSEALEAQLKVSFRSAPDTPVPFVAKVELHAAMAGMPLKSYVQAHSMLAIWGIRSGADQADNSETAERQRLLIHGTRTSRSAAYFCAECAKADVAFHGMSYWRREHQIPGAYGCSKHGVPLNFVNCFSIDLPPRGLSHASQVPHCLFEASVGSETVLRFQEFVHGLVQMNLTGSTERTYQTVRPCLARAGIKHYSYSGAKNHLLDLILASYPLAWLSANFADPKSSQRTQLFKAKSNGLDPLTRALPFWILTLATAALTSSSDEALNLWLRGLTTGVGSESGCADDLMPEASGELIQAVQNFCGQRNSDDPGLASQIDLPEELLRLLRSLASHWLAQKQEASESETSQATSIDLGGQLRK